MVGIFFCWCGFWTPYGNIQMEHGKFIQAFNASYSLPVLHTDLVHFHFVLDAHDFFTSFSCPSLFFFPFIAYIRIEFSVHHLVTSVQLMIRFGSIFVLFILKCSIVENSFIHCNIPRYRWYFPYLVLCCFIIFLSS